MNAAVHGWLGLAARLVVGGVRIVVGALKIDHAPEPSTSSA